MANEDRIPGVTFVCESGETKKVKGKLIAEVRLTAHINDLELFEQIEGKLDGMKVYAAEDFQTQVNGLLREDNDKLEVENERMHDLVVATSEVEKQNASFYQKRVEELQKENKALSVRVEQLEALERELQGLARA